MATTYVLYSGNGATTDFTITFAYTSESFIEVYVGGVLQARPAQYSFFSSTVIRFVAAPAAGTNNVEIRRNTSTTPLVDFTNGASLQDVDLDKANLQTLHILEEFENSVLTGMQSSGGTWNATNLRIANVATPTASGDAATKGYIDGQTTSAAASAAAALVSEAAAAASAVASAASASASSVSAAASAASAAAAAGSAGTIVAALPVTGLTANEIPVATAATTYDAIPVLLAKRLLSGTTAAAAQLDLALSATYDEYLLCIEEFQPASDGHLQLQFSIDSGATYKAGAGDYNYTFEARNAAGGTASGADSAGDTAIPLARNVESTRISRRCYVRIFAGNGSTLFQSIMSDTVYQDSGGSRISSGRTSGEMDGFATKATNVRLSFSSGNITTMTYALFGVVR